MSSDNRACNSIVELPDRHLEMVLKSDNAKSSSNFERNSQKLKHCKKLASSQVPDEILNDEKLAKLISTLPSNYNFEIAKTIWRIKSCNAQRIALQMPEGLLMFACVISDILEEYCYPQIEDIVIIADVTYGACCIDDYTARAFNCDFLVHYEISIDVEHFVECFKLTVSDKNAKVAIFSTVQYLSSLKKAAQALNCFYNSPVLIPQERPLSPGEVLGCTSPRLPIDLDCYAYVGDGRFHLESIMISNPNIPSYKYDPYSKILTFEQYDTVKMHSIRRNEIEKSQCAKIPLSVRLAKVGIILGMIGRQGSVDLLDRIKSMLDAQNILYIVVLLSEIESDKLKLFGPEIEVWIQIACPRLSIDWGHAFQVPLLNTYEAYVLFGGERWREDVYPMNYYSKTTTNLNKWSVNYCEKKDKILQIF